MLKLWELLRAAKTPDGRDAVYLGRYTGWYCPRCEGFKDEEELRQPGNVCPDHERPCEWTEEENFFFRLSAYEDWLRETIESDRLLIRPESRRNEILGVIKQGLKDFSVSRARVKWGIPVPEQPDHVLYVWVDALSNYITAPGFADDAPAYRRYWAEDAATSGCTCSARTSSASTACTGRRCCTRRACRSRRASSRQGFITKDGRKLSKTTGNVIDPVALVERLGPDAARYFLLREAPYGSDWDFTDTAFVGRYNADLANDLGNLVSRALTMVARYCDGKVPRAAGASGRSAGQAIGPAEAVGFEGLLEPIGDQRWLGRCWGLRARRPRCATRRSTSPGRSTELWSWIAQLNQAIVQVEPWTLAKDPARRGELDAFLYRLLEGVRLVAVLVSPVMPRAAARIFAMLGLGEREPGPADLGWGRLVAGIAARDDRAALPARRERAAEAERAGAEPTDERRARRARPRQGDTRVRDEADAGPRRPRRRRAGASAGRHRPPPGPRGSRGGRAASTSASSRRSSCGPRRSRRPRRSPARRS